MPRFYRLKMHLPWRRNGISNIRFSLGMWIGGFTRAEK